MKRLIQNVKSKLSNKKGMTTIEVAISVMLVVMALAGFVDMVNNSQKLDTASSVTGYVGRVVANQGGIQTTPTEHHVGNYVSSDQMYREVKSILENGGIPEKDFSLTINNLEITPGTDMEVQDFGERMRVELKIHYKWDLMSQMLPGVLDGEQISSRTVISSFKTRTGDIQSEYGTPTEASE